MVDDCRSRMDVLQGKKNGRELVATLGRYLDFFDGNDAELRLNLVITTHVVNTWGGGRF